MRVLVAEDGPCGMMDFSDRIEDSAACEMCDGPLTGARYVLAAEAALAVYCSEHCLRAAARERRGERWGARRTYARRLMVTGIFVGGFLAPHQGSRLAANRPRRSAPVQSPRPSDPPPLPPGWYGPEWPPTEISLLAVLGRDAWIHPLAGPIRRMPRTDARVFGAVRPGNRAVECRNGHCGVDLGGEIWGEHVRAVHEGVVDFVQRGPNPDHGGRFVRVSHRNGTVFTQYFHLAAIPRDLERGRPVKGGEVLGLLGDSGVKESAPHLHFTISIRPSKDGPEKYVDPEPLISLWALRVPLDGSEIGLVTTEAEVGVPLGSLPLRAGHKRTLAKQTRARIPSLGDEGAAGGLREATPEADEPALGTQAPDAPTEE
jgi:murein DD-endopeptidase MepM/ murein hydrolase activator NlpD